MKTPAVSWRDALLTTKLFAPPPRVNAVLRPRLLQRLDAALVLGHKLVLIAAPAGFGKTSVVSDWLNEAVKGTPQNRVQSVWLTLDEGDNDPARFLTYLLAALEPLANDVRNWDALEQRVSAYPPPPPESILTPALNHLPHADTQPRLIVLDDYHVIQAPAIHNALTFLIEHLPPHFHLVLTTRADPPLPFARWRGRGQITELRAADLTFTSAETTEFLTRTMQLDLESSQIEALKARTEGWVAGLQLASIALASAGQGEAPRADRARFISAFTGTHRVVSDYLMEEVLNLQAPALQKFLLETSMLDRLCAPLCDATQGGHLLTLEEGEVNARGVLDLLERSHLFLTPLDDAREWYHYHPLWRDALRHRLRQTEPAHERALHERASAWFENNGLTAEAVQHAFAANDMERAARLVETHAHQMILRSDLTPLGEWLERLPESVFETRPRLSLDRLWWFFLTASRLEIDEALPRAARALASSTLPPRAQELLRGELETIQSAIVLERGDLRGALEHATRAETLFGDTEVDVRGLPEMYGALAKFWGGQVIGVADEFAQAAQHATRVGDHYGAFISLCTRGEVLLMQGRVRQALAQLLELETRAQQLGIERRPYVALLYVNLGMVYYELNELDACATAFEQALELSEFGGMPRPREWLISVAFLGWLSFLSGDRNRALALIARGEEHLKQYRLPAWAKSHLLDTEQCLGFWDHDLDGTRRWLERHEIFVSDEPDYVNEVAQMAIVRVKLMHGELEPARTQIQRMVQAAEQAARHGSLFRLYALQAVVHEHAQEHAAALASLERALDLGQPQGLTRALVDEGDAMVALLSEISQSAQADQSPMRLAYIRRLMLQAEHDSKTSGAVLHALPAKRPTDTVRPKPAPSPAGGVESLQDPLSAREIELLALVAEGYSNREIAEKVSISLGTVKTHVNNIFRKLDAYSRTQAVKRARELGLLD